MFPGKCPCQLLDLGTTNDPFPAFSLDIDPIQAQEILVDNAVNTLVADEVVIAEGWLTS
jgi:hypothetical protein